MDRHLNLFYSYNRDNELIENNLTRAFIVTLRALGGENRDEILRGVLRGRAHKVAPSFRDATVALQGNVDRDQVLQYAERFILAIATADHATESEELTGRWQVPGTSIPDAWIFTPGGYCYLIESKVGNNPQNPKQIRGHGEWLDLHGPELDERLIRITWFHVLDSIQSLLTRTANRRLTDQEQHLLKDLVAFFGYFNYQHFHGLNLGALLDAPTIQLAAPPAPRLVSTKLLAAPPNFAIAIW